MPAALPLKQPVKVGQLLRRRLRELKRTPRELADAVNVSEDYMADLVTGRRRPPAPGRTDLYAPMTKFLRLHRNDLPTCARAERAAGPAGRRRPDAEVSRQVLELCLPERQRVLQRRRPFGRRRVLLPIRGLELHDVLRRGTLLPLHDVELNPLTLGERLEPLCLDRGVVHEAILLTVLRRDKAETLRIVEPLHDPGNACHLLILLT